MDWLDRLAPNSVTTQRAPIGLCQTPFVPRRQRKLPRQGSVVALFVLLGLALAVIGFSVRPALAAERGIIDKGDAAVTAFSGTTTGEVPKGVHPLDVTVIDLKKPTLQVFDLSKLGGPPAAHLANAPSKFEVKAGAIGQVFGVTLDGGTDGAPPNIYAGASSLFGLQIVDGGGGRQPLRLVKGAPGAAWMPGQFGLDKGGGPGSIWKIDGKTGDVSLFSTITSGSYENAGPGLAGLAFDSVSQQIFAANLETGLIHRLDLSGRELGTFDHGIEGRSKAGLEGVAGDEAGRMDIQSARFSIEDASTWGYADARRRVVALAVESGRLYYSVAEGPVVWSVGLAADGGFIDDARLEIDVTGTPNGNMITAIAFDGPEKLYLTQRGETAGAYDYGTFARPQASIVYRYSYDASAKSWTSSPDEFAIGLEPPHRATNGGIALNYGYDKNGNIDFGACRETLWTTGEHLMNGGDGKPRTVHGLQGNYKNLAKPVTYSSSRSGSSALNAGGSASVADSSLETPTETWFTDFDGALDEDNGHGPIGQVAIFTTCNKQASAAPRPEYYAVPLAPKRRPPGIYTSKECFPGPIGGVIQCRITVTNTGITQPAPVNITDASTILSGPGANSALAVQSATPDGLDWFCTPTPTTAFQCTLPAGSIAPGSSRFVDVFVNTGPSTAAGNLGLRNCATSLAPFPDKACSQSGDGTTGLIISKSGPAQCNPGTSCVFTLSIKNNSSQPFTGPVQISDAMFVGGASVAAPITASNLTCNGGNPATLPFTCVTPVTLAPGATQSFSMTVTMPAAPPNFWAQNCFAAFNPAFVPPGGPLPSPGGPGGPGVGSPTNPACAWVAAGNPPPQSNLRITKTPLAGTCVSSIGTGIASCQYQVRISNDGPTPFNNVVTINEVPPAGSNMLLSPNWPCAAAAPGFNCTSPAPIVIPPGSAFLLTATIQIPPLLTQPSCLVPNTVSIAAPLGAPQNITAADDTATATMSTALLAVLNPNGTVSVACDPTNLKTTKAVEKCIDAGSSMKCTHSITVANTGPDPYEGPINITDQYSAAPANVSFPAGWTCNAASTGFLCTKPGVKLSPPGKSGAHSIVLEVTANIPKGNACVLRNTATMSFPPADTPFNLRGDDDSSTVSTPIPSPECEKKPSCDNPGRDEFRSASGACVCEIGASRDRRGECQSVRDTPPTVEPESPPPKAKDTCPDGNPVPRSGSCPCPSGDNWNADKGSCEAACRPGRNEYRTSAGVCLCKTGYHRDGDACVSGRDEPRPPGIVPPDRDECGYNEVRASGKCVCSSGYSRDDGRCVKDREPELCDPGPNEYRTPGNRCVCREGYERRGRECVPERDEPRGCQPGPNEFKTSKGSCLCREGYERNGRGVCVEEYNPADDCTRSGRFWTGRRCIDPPSQADICHDRGGNWNGRECVYGPSPVEVCHQRGGRMIDGDCVIEQKVCDEGYTGRYPNCVPIGPRPDVVCERNGGRFVRGECVYPQKQCQPGYEGRYPDCKMIKPEGPNLKDICIKAGGRFINGDCIYKQPQRPVDDTPSKRPDVPQNNLNDNPPAKKPSPAQECAERGGSYEEGDCVYKKEDDSRDKDKLREQEKLKQQQLQQQKQRENQQQKQQEQMKQQQENQQQKQREQQEQKQRENQQQKQQEQKQRENQQQKQQEQKKQQQENQQQKQQQQQQQQQQQKQNQDKGNKTLPDCPPGRHRNPDKGNKCTKT